MATKRRKTTPTTQRRRRSLRAGRAANMKAAANDTIMGAIGGAAAAFIILNVAAVKDQSDTNKALILGAASLGAGMFLKKPSIAAGIAGIAGMTLLKGTGVLADNGTMYLPAISQPQVGRIPAGLASDYAGMSSPNVYASYYANRFQ